VATSSIAHARTPAGDAPPNEERLGAFLKHAEVRDVRALSRPPIELHQVELARVIQVARRGKLDLVRGLAAAIESPQVPPEARERIQRFLALHASATAELDGAPADAFLTRLVELLGARSRAPLAASEVGGERQGVDAGEPDGELRATFELLREELLDGVMRIGGRLGELRLDTDLDISHGVVRYMELLKVAALLQRPAGQSVEDALADVNARLLAAATPLQREILQTSTHEQHSLTPFLPRKGAGLALSASDIHTYRSCPLRYKFARVLRIPTEQTVNQRFGIVVHQVLERYHRDGGETLAQLLALLDGCWRRSGFGEDGLDQELFEKARAALTRYHERLRATGSRPVWFERPFQFQIGPHHLRGRVDRVDRLGDGEDAEHELIDYKTSRPKDAEQLYDDVQLSLYALAAREDWGLARTSQAYYYVLDDLKVPIPSDGRDPEALKELVIEVGEGILAQEFEPKPSPSVCSGCDYRIVCPAAA
jgi:DNA helicase-2/ATP-dependent DNA helicase PcrA